MTSNSPKNSNDPFFVTPEPSVLQSEENRAEMREQYEDADPNGPFYVADEIAEGDTLPYDLDELSQSEDNAAVPGFDPDAIAQSGGDAAVSEGEQDTERLRDRQIGTAFRSGS